MSLHCFCLADIQLPYFWAMYSHNHVRLFLNFGYLKLSVDTSEACAEGEVGLPAAI